MSTITIQATNPALPGFHFSPTPSAVYLRVYLLKSFMTSAGVPLQSSAPDDKAWYKQVTCSLAATSLTIPSFTLDSTTDGLDHTDARYGCYFYDQNGRQLKAYEGFDQFKLHELFPSQSWEDIRKYNVTRAVTRDNSTYTKDEVVNLINSHGGVSGLSGDVTTTGTGVAVATIAAGAVIFSKMQNVATGVLLGRSTGGTGNVESITIGTGLTLAAGVLTGTAAGVDLTTDQTVAGNKSFTGITKFGSGTNINDNGWASTGGTSVMAHGADSSSGSPNSSGNASLTFQTWRSGGTVGTGVFGYQFGVNRIAGQGDQYGLGVLLRYSPDMSAFTAGGTNYFQTGLKGHIVMSPTNIPAGANAIGFNHMMGERTVANVRVVGLQTEAVNNSSTDADNDGSTIDSTIGQNIAGGGIHHNSVGIQFEASRPTSFAIGFYPKRNSIHRYIHDYTAAQYDLQGTVTVTNGSPTVTGVSTRFIKEAVKGDQVGIDGVNWYEVASTPGSDGSLTLTTNYAGSTQSAQTLTKIVTPFRLLRPSYIAATDTINTYRLIGLNASNQVKIDADGTGIFAGTTPVQITDTLGKVVPELSKTALSLVNGLNSNVTLPALAGWVRQDGPTGAFSLGGFTNGRAGREVVWFNATSQTMTIVNEDASSTAANRINTLTGGNVTLRAFQSCARFLYSDTDSRWILTATN